MRVIQRPAPNRSICFMLCESEKPGKYVRDQLLLDCCAVRSSRFRAIHPVRRPAQMTTLSVPLSRVSGFLTRPEDS
jgi:hypothetical protein